MEDSALIMLSEVKEPLRAAFGALSAQSNAVLREWRRLLRRSKLCGKYVNVLSELQPGAQLPQDFREAAERQGQDLARDGLPAECVPVALNFFLEACLPHLYSNKSLKAEWVRALTRWSGIYQYFLLTGYVHFRESERQALEERMVTSERRLQDFSVQLAEAYEKERRRLAQDLHDEIGHDLIVLKLYTEVIALDLKKNDISQLRRKLKESVNLIKHALKSVRHLTFDLGPAIWNEQGFVPAVRLYARQFAKRTGIKVRLDAAKMKARLPARCETALYKVLQGALSNVVAHANAHNVKITLASTGGYATMKIEDDGRGFNVGRKMGVPRQSYGLRAMRERVELLGGAVHFVSHPSSFRANTAARRLKLVCRCKIARSREGNR